jgi:hypothetical protein
MKNVRLKTETQSVLKNFVNELSKELNVDFKYFDKVEFQRGIPKGKKRVGNIFYSPMYRSLSVGLELSFIPYSDNTIELWKINVGNRGNGKGSVIMNRILDVSDRLGITIKLIPIDYDRDENSQINYLNKLKNWYWEMGFEKPKFSFDPYYTYFPSVEEFKMVG